MTIERCYNEMKWLAKSDVQFPSYYYQLDVEQKRFVDELFESIHKPVTLQEDIEYLEELSKEFGEATAAFRRRYSRA